MAFSESIKTEVMRKANFRCSWCQEIRMPIEVHHIIPLNAGGSDNIDNAATLCPSCHQLIGSNPDHRKQLRERRNHVYSLAPSSTGDKKIEDVYHMVRAIQQNQANNKKEIGDSLERLKGELKDIIFHQYIDRLTPGTSGEVASAILNISSGNVLRTQQWENIYSPVDFYESAQGEAMITAVPSGRLRVSKKTFPSSGEEM